MVSGHLQIKKGYYYVVLSYYDNRNKRHVKYVSTGLPEKGNKRKAEAALARVRSEFEPPQEVGELASNMPFAEYLLEWLDIVKVRVKATTYSSAMVKSTLEPYFRKKGYTLQGLEARHIQQFYTEKLKTVKPSSVIHYHAVIHQALKYAMKTDLVTQNVAMKVDRPKQNDYQPVFLDAEELQRLFQVVKGTRLELPVLVAAFYGLRRGEVCGLKWDAIDFERGTIDILMGVAKEFKVSTDYILGLSTVSVRKSYDISELGLSEGAVRGLVTGTVDVQILNRLLEHRNFPKLIE